VSSSAQRRLAEIRSRIIACARCPELRAYCASIAADPPRAHRGERYWARPVPALGDPHARVVLVGLAPGAHGSNRTGRMFTGDASGDFLYPALYRAGFASQPHATHRRDGLRLHDCFITAALRCAPPGNKPTPAQLRRCFPYLLEEFDVLTGVRVLVALGAIGFSAILRVLRERGFGFPAQTPRFAHGAEYRAVADGRTVYVVASYHPSRQNTNTGKLTAAMLDAVLRRARDLAESK